MLYVICYICYAIGIANMLALNLQASVKHISCPFHYILWSSNFYFIGAGVSRDNELPAQFTWRRIVSILSKISNDYLQTHFKDAHQHHLFWLIIEVLW